MSIVETGCGRLRGQVASGVHVFRGIPFARPPVGDLRWQAPTPPEPWAGVRDALDFGPCAIQSTLPGAVGELIGIATHETSEDCLYLNVWTPAPDDTKRPVMVWIHGGGNTVGAGSQPRVNGEHLARIGDVVVVTVNYRLGALGFLHAAEPARAATKRSWTKPRRCVGCVRRSRRSEAIQATSRCSASRLAVSTSPS